MWIVLHPIQMGHSSPFLIRREQTQSFWFSPQPPTTPCRAGAGMWTGFCMGPWEIAETRPVCGGPLSPGVCLSVWTGACVHRCLSPPCSSKRQCQLQKQESLALEGRNPAPAQLWHQFTTGSEQVSSAFSWGLISPIYKV